ncbi:HNH endonuclease [Roseovarius aestuariivivens]|uniref:HNH endonuclease n=1 Tax=Roseovarius aestuariivivens TaxID=1888910 RepID=UPI001FDA981C|nr:HNH endonuclease [Roseovarius aestuariivivens]
MRYELVIGGFHRLIACVLLRIVFPDSMTKLVLLHKADSIYDDEPDVVYDFPRSYLKAVREAVGDWVVYYEPVKAGPRGYFAVAKIEQVIPKPGVEGRFLAMIEPGSFLPLDTEVPRLIDGSPLEQALTEPDGSPKKGGAVQLAVRRLPDEDFARIVRLGLPEDLERREAIRYDLERSEVAEEAAIFERPVLERLTRRPYRDVAFRRKVREAYGYRCAMSGLKLRNGGGRPEVQAAHVRPVEHNGSDSVRNGLALSGTLHWMFDRGLISVAEDNETILVSRNKVPGDVVDRLLSPDGKIWKPEDKRNWPHPANLKWHRENIFGQMAAEGSAPWE